MGLQEARRERLTLQSDASSSSFMPSWERLLPDTFWEEVAFLLSPTDLFFLSITSSTMLSLLRSPPFLAAYCEHWMMSTYPRCFCIMKSEWHQNIHYQQAHTGLISQQEAHTYLRILDDLIDEWGPQFCHFDVNEWFVPQRIRELDWFELNGDFRLLFRIWRDEDWNLWNDYLDDTDYNNMLFYYDDQNRGWESTKLHDLSDTLLSHIFCCLAFKDILKLGGVCQKFSRITTQSDFTISYIQKRGEEDCVKCSFCHLLFATISYLEVHHRFQHANDITSHEYRVYFRMLNTYHFTNDLDDFCCTPSTWEYLFTNDEEAICIYEDYSQPTVSIPQFFENLQATLGDNDWKRYQAHLMEEGLDYLQRDFEQTLAQDEFNHIRDMSECQQDQRDLEGSMTSWNSIPDYMSDD